MVEEHKQEDGSTRYIKDLFVKEYGSIEEHKKWIQENCVFILKSNDESHQSVITIEEWLKLVMMTEIYTKRSRCWGKIINR